MCLPSNQLLPHIEQPLTFRKNNRVRWLLLTHELHLLVRFTIKSKAMMIKELKVSRKTHSFIDRRPAGSHMFLKVVTFWQTKRNSPFRYCSGKIYSLMSFHKEHRGLLF